MRSSYASAALHLPLFPMMISTLAALLAAAPAPPQRAFVNFETPQVSPLDLTPDGQRLLAVNTADGVLEVLDVSGSSPVPLMAVPVGVDPVSVRARTDDEAGGRADPLTLPYIVPIFNIDTALNFCPAPVRLTAKPRESAVRSSPTRGDSKTPNICYHPLYVLREHAD